MEETLHSKSVGLRYESVVYTNGEIGLRSSTFFVPKPTNMIFVNSLQFQGEF